MTWTWQNNTHKIIVCTPATLFPSLLYRNQKPLWTCNGESGCAKACSHGRWYLAERNREQQRERAVWIINSSIRWDAVGVLMLEATGAMWSKLLKTSSMRVSTRLSHRWLWECVWCVCVHTLCWTLCLNAHNVSGCIQDTQSHWASCSLMSLCSNTSGSYQPSSSCYLLLCLLASLQKS